MSAECNLAGMYPPIGRQQWNGTATNWQPIPVHTVPVGEDKVFEICRPSCSQNVSCGIIFGKYANGPEMDLISIVKIVFVLFGTRFFYCRILNQQLIFYFRLSKTCF